MKYTSKLRLLFLLIILCIGCKTNTILPTISSRNPLGFEAFMDGYRVTYLQDPQNIQDLIKFAKFESKINGFYNISQKEAIWRLNDIQKNTNIKKKNGYIELIYRDTLFRCPIFSFERLGSIDSAYPDYIRGIHSFKKNKEPVKKKINEEIQYGLRKIFQYYSKVDLLTLDNGEASFMIVEYLASMNKLINRTGEKYDYLLKEPYFQDLKMYFEAACKKYNLSRIVYSTRIWTK